MFSQQNMLLVLKDCGLLFISTLSLNVLYLPSSLRKKNLKLLFVTVFNKAIGK